MSEHPKANAELLHPDRPFVTEIPKLRRLAASQGLTGLANDTKWNELITAMRAIPQENWSPSFRFRCIDSDRDSLWDGEWWHHLPFPFVSVRWFELSLIEKIHRGRLLTPDLVDHSAEIESIVENIGFDYERSGDTIRIFGYAPRIRSGTDQNNEEAEQAGDGDAEEAV